MQEQHALPYLREVLLFLALAGILIPLLQRLRINQILGFLAAGAAVGPFGLGLWAQQYPWIGYFAFLHGDDIAPLAELGVLFLMFMIGLELSTERLWALRRWVFGAGTAQVGVCAFCIGATAYAFGNPLETAIVLGLVLSLSSTAVVMQLMVERRILGTPLGQAGFSILMLQDLAVVPILILVSVLTSGGSANVLSALGLALVKSVGAIVLTMDYPASALHAVKAIRRKYPDMPLYARSRDEKHALALKAAGATLVIPETLESGLQLSAFVLQALGIHDSAAGRIIQRERERHIAGLGGDR